MWIKIQNNQKEKKIREVIGKNLVSPSKIKETKILEILAFETVEQDLNDLDSPQKNNLPLKNADDANQDYFESLLFDEANVVKSNLLRVRKLFCLCTVISS